MATAERQPFCLFEEIKNLNKSKKYKNQTFKSLVSQSFNNLWYPEAVHVLVLSWFCLGSVLSSRTRIDGPKSVWTVSSEVTKLRICGPVLVLLVLVLVLQMYQRVVSPEIEYLLMSQSQSSFHGDITSSCGSGSSTLDTAPPLPPPLPPSPCRGAGPSPSGRTGSRCSEPPDWLSLLHHLRGGA